MRRAFPLWRSPWGGEDCAEVGSEFVKEGVDDRAVSSPMSMISSSDTLSSLDVALFPSSETARSMTCSLLISTMSS